MILNGDPGVDKNYKPCARFFYRRGLNAISVWVIHDGLTARINEFGDSGMPLQKATDLLMSDLLNRDIIEPTVHTL